MRILGAEWLGTSPSLAPHTAGRVAPLARGRQRALTGASGADALLSTANAPGKLMSTTLVYTVNKEFHRPVPATSPGAAQAADILTAKDAQRGL